MKKLLLLTTVLLLGAICLQAQKLIPEKMNPHFGPFHMGTELTGILKFTNPDQKTVKISRLYCDWTEGALSGYLDPGQEIIVKPGEIWELQIPIKTVEIGVRTMFAFCSIESNAVNNMDRIPIEIEVINPSISPN